MKKSKKTLTSRARKELVKDKRRSEQVAIIKHLFKEGFSFSEIAKKIDFNDKSIIRVLEAK